MKTKKYCKNYKYYKKYIKTKQKHLTAKFTLTKKNIIFFGILLIISLSLLGAYALASETTIFSSKNEIRFENASYEIFFCPRENCTHELNSILSAAEEEIVCAFFDLDVDILKDTLEKKSKKINVSVIIDAHNDEDMDYDFVHVKDFYALMHNKFCVIDKKITFTGSMNPTLRGTTKNNNNMLITNSTVIAKNHHNYYDFLLDTIDTNRRDIKNDFSRDAIFYTQGTNLKNYFCPWDDCRKQVIIELSRAKKSIYFMTFSFTDNQIANELLMKHYSGVEIKGVYEKTQNSKYSTYNLLAGHDVQVKIDSNKYNMHHKVFIIDNKTVIFGSYNPSESGTSRNDENMLIVTNKYIAERFLEEWGYVYGEN